MSSFFDRTGLVCLALSFVFVGICCFLSECEREGQNEVTVRTKSDTVYVSKKDTVFVDRVMVPPTRIDTFVVFDKDTLFIEGTALDTIYIDSLSLQLSKTERIIRDSIFITLEKTNEERFSWDIGANIYPGFGNTKFDIGVVTGFNIGKNSIEAGYNFVNRQINIGYRRKILTYNR